VAGQGSSTQAVTLIDRLEPVASRGGAAQIPAVLRPRSTHDSCIGVVVGDAFR
jgi:hypothetical protein